MIFISVEFIYTFPYVFLCVCIFDSQENLNSRLKMISKKEIHFREGKDRRSKSVTGILPFYFSQFNNYHIGSFPWSFQILDWPLFFIRVE